MKFTPAVLAYLFWMQRDGAETVTGFMPAEGDNGTLL
jgi:hypothetical protein